MNQAERKLESVFREIDRIVDHAVAETGEAEFEQMLGALQGIARFGSGISQSRRSRARPGQRRSESPV